jgi:hypothetical protein
LNPKPNCHEAKREGLNLNLKAKERTKKLPRGSEDLEACLSAVEKESMDKIFDKGNGYEPNLKSEDIKAVNKNLKLTSTVIISMDKTNSFRCIHIDDYENWMIKHLLKNGKEIPRSKLVQVFDDGNGLLENLEHILSEDEHFFVKESINPKTIPAQKLLIKDYKEINDDGNYPTRLVVPATNFTLASQSWATLVSRR